MKKALVILMALAMVFAAFADEPNVTPTVNAFGGNAEFGYKINLEDEAFGMYNSSDANLKITWIGGEVTKATEGSGVWGELKIKVNSELALEAKASDAADKTGSLTVKKPSVEVAKIHFGDVLAINIKDFGLKIGKKDAALATGASVAGVAEVGEDPANAAGFRAEIALDPIALNITVADNGVVASGKKIGFAADVTVKPIDGLAIYGGATYLNDFAAAANLEYALKLNDTMTLTPWAGMTYTNDVVYAAGVLLGWGGKDIEAKFKKPFVADKMKDGFSFAMNSDKDFVVGAFDSVFLKDFGLKAGFDYKANFDTAGEGTLNTDVAGSWDVDIFSIAAYVGFQDNLGTEATDYVFGASVANKTLIANTELKAAYDGGKDDKGAIVLSAKISL